MAVKVGDLIQDKEVEEVVTNVVAAAYPPTAVDFTVDPRTQVSKFPIEPTKPTDVIGYDYDPYDIDYGGYDQHTDVWNPMIPFHNYRQRHVSQNAFFTGYGSTLPLPKCPPLWGDVTHYWDSICFLGWLCYEAPRWGGGALIVIATGWLKANGWM